MPPKKNYRQRPAEEPDLKNGEEEEKENNPQLRRTKCTKKQTKLHPVKKKVEVDKFAQPLMLKINDCTTSRTDDTVKPPGFWSRKLQDLEENETKIKKHGLYEFSGTDESESSYKTTKKRKQKARSQKKKQPLMPKYNKAIAKMPKKKTEEIQKAWGRNQVMLIKEKQQLADEDKKFTFSQGMQSLGITSTPAINKNNLVGASNFLFLSPIIKDDDDYCNNSTQCLPLKLKDDDDHDGTPKVSTKLKRLSYRRVLRNGKMFGT